MKYLDRIIERGVLFLLIFTPLAIGTVQQWSIAVMEIAAFVILSAWLLKSFLKPGPSASDFLRPDKWLFLFPVIFILLTICQTIPLPYHWIAAISPNTALHYTTFIDDPAGAFHTLSICPDATFSEILKLLSYMAVFFVIINHYDTESGINGIFRNIVYMGCFLAVFAVAQKMTWNGNLFWFYPVREGLTPFGPYINRNHFAGYMEMATLAGMGLYMHRVSKIRNIPYIPGMPLKKRLASYMDGERIMTSTFSLVSVIITSGALFMVHSRGAIAGFVISMLFFTGMIRSKRSLRKKTGFLALLGVIIFFTVVAASWSALERRFEEWSISEDGRGNIWSDVISISRDFPLIGTGMGTFKDIYPQYQKNNSNMIFEHPESDYAEVLTDTGLVGLTAVLGILTLFFSSVVLRWRQRQDIFILCTVAGGLASIVAMTAHGITDFNMHIPANAMLLTIIAGATYAAVYNIETKDHAYRPKRGNEAGKAQ